MFALAAMAVAGFSSGAAADPTDALPVVVACQGPGLSPTQTGGLTLIPFVPGGAPGQCTVQGLLNRQPVLFIPPLPNLNLVVEAARKGGTFIVTALRQPNGFQVLAINQVNVVDATPPEPAGGQADCPAGVARVSTPPGLDFLNVRSGPSKGADVVAQVPNGSEVTVTGSCLTKPAAGFAKQKPQAAWCRIEQPDQGCVASEFLVFAGDGGGGGLKPAAGFAKTKKKK
jgi:hypothetical protein